MTVAEYKKDPYKQYLAKVSQVESGGKANAKNPNSTAGGKWQFTASTFKGMSDRYNLGYNVEDRFDPKKSEEVARLFTRDNANAIQPVLGREVNDADLYMAHFLGAGGANKFFTTYNQNPNTPVSDILSPQAIAANKNVVFNKDGSIKTAEQLYNWAQNKMNITSEITDFEDKEEYPIFTGQPTNLQSLPEAPQEKEKIQEVKEQLKQKTNEYNFIEEYKRITEQQRNRQTVQQEEPQQELEAPQNYLEQYAQVSAFIENPLMQQGGIINDNRGQYAHPGKITRIQSPNITMRGVENNLMGISEQTGEIKIMNPNIDYFFNNTQSVLEIPFK